MASSNPVQQRREQMAKAMNMGGWYLASFCDGWDETGRPKTWYEYEHLDGRKATVSESGSATDPELQRLLEERDRERKPSQSEAPARLSPLGRIRALNNWLTARKSAAE